MCLKVGLVLSGKNLDRVRSTIEHWAATTRRVDIGWNDEPVGSQFGQALPEGQEQLSLHLGDRETGCSCGLAIERPRGWRRSAMSDLGFLLKSLADEPIDSLRLGVAWEGEAAELEQVSLSLSQFRRLVKRGALGRNHLYSVACG